MLWDQIFLIALLFSTLPSACSCETASARSYRLGSGDIDFGSMQILRASPDQFVMLKRPIGAGREQVYLSGNGKKWHRASQQQELALTHLVTASGAGRGKTLYRVSGNYSSLEGSSVLERSDDLGKSWRRATLRFQSLAGSPEGVRKQIRLRILGVNDLTLYASIAVANEAAREWKALPGIYVSRDGGDQWRLFSTDLSTESAVVETDKFIFGLGSTGLVKSKDDGRTWTPAEIGQRLPAAFSLQGFENAPIDRKSKPLEVYQLEFQPGDPPSAFLVTNGGLFITHDNGKTWCLVTFDSDALYTVQSVAIADGDGLHVLATTAGPKGSELWESKDGGKAFNRVPLTNTN